MFVELSNDSSFPVNQAQSYCRYDLYGVDSAEDDVVVKDGVTAADVGSNIVSKIPCDDVDDDAVWDEYIINFDVQQHTDCAFHNDIQTLDRALYASGCVPVSQVCVVDPDIGPR